MILGKSYYKGKFFVETMISSFNSSVVTVIQSMFGQFGEPIHTDKSVPHRDLPLFISGGDSICDGCMECVDICPTNCIDIIKDKKSSVYSLSVDVSLCLYCNYCSEICPKKVITLFIYDMGDVSK